MTTPPAEPPAGDGERATSVDELAARQERVEGKLDELIGLVKGATDPKGSGGSSPTPPPSDSNSDGSLEQRVQEELARRDKDAADTARAQEHESLKAQVAKLSETKPRPPGSKLTKVLGWGDGR